MLKCFSSTGLPMSHNVICRNKSSLLETIGVNQRQSVVAIRIASWVSRIA
jgi:hypothetical protein